MKCFVAVLFLLVPIWAHGATCPAGQYLENNVCKDCIENYYQNYYCPGDDTRHECPSADGINLQQLVTTDCGLHDVPVIPPIRLTWGSPVKLQPDKIINCYVAAKQGDIQSREGQFIIEIYYKSIDGHYWKSCYDDVAFWSANPGYYLSTYKNTTFRDWYHYIKPCTNEHPAHSHYSGPGTPDDPVKTGGRKDYNDCPWACDDGYGRHNDECLPLCAAGATKFHVGDYVFNIYKEKLTTPAINIGFSDGTVCYVPLVEGLGKGALNVDYHGVIYHTSD